MKQIKVREFQDVMQNLYKAAGRYTDERLVKAVEQVRDLVVEYKSIIDSINEKNREN